jgi:Predicted phosphatase
VVVYCGDDARFEYIYKFVTKDLYQPDNRLANRELLDSGTLYVARFKDDGSGVWLPLVFGEGALTPKNGFHSQAEVLINARRAADLLGATPMDRPEDIETNPLNGKVYVVLTNNSKRTGEPGLVQAEGHTVATEPTAPNPRRPNKTGHIIEITEVHGNHAARSFTWSIFMLCGNPLDPKGRLLTALYGTPVGTHDTYFAGFSDANAISPIGSPDNIAFDRQGNLWVATDGQTKDLNLAQPINDGLYAVPVEGRERGFLRQFLSAPRGSEVVGPAFAPDARTLFVGIQHPGEDGTLDKPVSSWPDGNGHVPRPSVLAITKADGRLIGS